MKAIVVRQPWATLIALGIKTLETRPGPPNGRMRPDGVRGLPGCSLERGERVAIVAGKEPPTAPLSEGGPMDYGQETDGSWWVTYGDDTDPTRLPLGAVVCTVTVDDALPISPDKLHGSAILNGVNGLRIARHSTYNAHGWRLDHSVKPQPPLGDFTPGRWGWLLGGVQPCEPIPCKGRQGVFVLPDEVAEKIR